MDAKCQRPLAHCLSFKGAGGPLCPLGKQGSEQHVATRVVAAHTLPFSCSVGFALQVVLSSSEMPHNHTGGKHKKPSKKALATNIHNKK